MRCSFVVSAGVLVAVLFIGCGSAESTYSSGVPIVSAEPTAGVAANVAFSERKQIRTARLELRSDDSALSTAKIEDLTTNLGGYVSSKETQAHEIRGYVSLTLRVPNDKLEMLLKGIRDAVTAVDAESISTQEVTEQFIDLTARLKTLSATETEIAKLLEESRERKASVDDIMAVHQRMIDIRTQIESTQGKLNVLDRQSEMATLFVTMRPVETAVPIVSKRWQPMETIHASVRFLVRALQVIATVLIVAAIDVVPLLLIFGVPVWGVASLFRQRRQTTSI
ncbi:MAG: DUF4349 domain-containing protein [Planctomycetota bacterium]|nr:DUF4349 domain-containing protein [Planctomycetota bacterium]